MVKLALLAIAGRRQPIAKMKVLASIPLAIGNCLLAMREAFIA